MHVLLGVEVMSECLSCIADNDSKGIEAFKELLMVRVYHLEINRFATLQFVYV